MNPSTLPNRSTQRGQAVLWFLAMVAACCAMFAVVYNVGQVTNEKEKTINAADAAAISGALVEARILNFTAYTNRAMIANEVTIAQLVSTDSFIRYDATMAHYVALYLQALAVIPIVGTAIVDTLNAYDQAMQYVKDGTDLAVEAAIPACNIAIKVLKIARDAALVAAPLAADNVASGIASANQTTFGSHSDQAPELNPAFRAAFLGTNTLAWMSFWKVNDSGSDRDPARDVILESRDQFAVSRGEGPFISALNTALEVGGLAASGLTEYYGFDKTSTETKLKDYDHWEAQDTLDAFHATIDWCGPFPCGYVKMYENVPLAYGRTDADNDGSSDSLGRDLCHPSFLSLNGLIGTTVNCIAAGQDANVISSDPLPNIVDLRTQGGNPTLTFVAGVQKAGNATLTTQRLGSPGMNSVPVKGPQGSPDLKDNLQNGDRLTSIASAKVFFARPDWNDRDITEGSLPRLDRVHEYASLYNPYWQARLSPTDDKTKAGFYALIGSSPALSIVTP